MCMEGLGFWFFVFVKCMSPFFTWSVFRPLLSSHLCVSLNAMVIILAVVSIVGPDAMIAPLSMYSVVGESIILLSLCRGGLALQIFLCMQGLCCVGVLADQMVLDHPVRWICNCRYGLGHHFALDLQMIEWILLTLLLNEADDLFSDPLL